MGKHKCEKHMSYGRCDKCNRPKWSLNRKNPFKLGDKVTLRDIDNYTYRKRRFVIDLQFEDGSFRLIFCGGKERNTPIERYSWWELLKFKKRCK